MKKLTTPALSLALAVALSGCAAQKRQHFPILIRTGDPVDPCIRLTYGNRVVRAEHLDKHCSTGAPQAPTK